MAHDPLTDPKFARCVARFTIACAASRAHSNLAAVALDTYGSHGALISGCVRAHFPELIKEELRRLARMCSTECDNARNARPARVHSATVNHIGRLVATRDGSGYYGPQPL